MFGRIQGSLDEKTRILEVNRPEGSENADNLMIPCRYWTLTPNCLLTSIKQGAAVTIRGRIENDEKIGFFVIVEQIVILRQ